VCLIFRLNQAYFQKIRHAQGAVVLVVVLQGEMIWKDGYPI